MTGHMKDEDLKAKMREEDRAPRQEEPTEREGNRGEKDENPAAGEKLQAGSGFDGRDESLEEIALLQQQKIAELEQRVDELRESNLRKAAELDNMRKRTQRERFQVLDKAKAESVERFLPINDDLQRTIRALDELGSDKNLKGVVDGIRLVAGKFEEALGEYGVVRIDETGVPFDVDMHDALMRRKVEDPDVESNTVVEVIESGYRMGDRTIRYAKVIVSE